MTHAERSRKRWTCGPISNAPAPRWPRRMSQNRVSTGRPSASASSLGGAVRWVGVDSSPAQLAANPYRPVVLADMRALPFRDGAFAEVAHLWCLYHLDDPRPAIAEAARVLRPGGRYFACTAARDNDPEIMPEGYPPSSFDAEEAAGIVASAFNEVEAERWDGKFFPLRTREEVRAYCRASYIPAERAEAVDMPQWLTKRGVVIRAEKPSRHLGGTSAQ